MITDTDSNQLDLERIRARNNPYRRPDPHVTESRIRIPLQQSFGWDPH
jgi:hypothetical protein